MTSTTGRPAHYGWTEGRDPEYADVREELKRKLWEAQAAAGDEPHPSQPVTEGITAG